MGLAKIRDCLSSLLVADDLPQIVVDHDCVKPFRAMQLDEQLQQTHGVWPATDSHAYLQSI
jgi:hypothetical protein